MTALSDPPVVIAPPDSPARTTDRSSRSVVRGLLHLLRDQLSADRVLLIDGATAEPMLSVGDVAGSGAPSVRQAVTADRLLIVAGRAGEDLTARDRALLRDVAALIAPHLPALDDTIAALGGPNLESLTRPLLAALQELTQLGSTYLTHIDEAADDLQVLLAHNTRPGFTVSEGIHVPWGDTLCKRSLDEGRAVTPDVPAVWGDSAAARELGIRTYVSVPVELSDGQIWGTLCAADSQTGDPTDEHVAAMRLFSRLIAAEIERSAALARAESDAVTDPLTGCATRRVIEPRLTAALGQAGPDDTVMVAFVDVDDFKPINDTLGHETGDRVLAAIGAHLRDQMRPDDLVARYGGDEFVLVAVMPGTAGVAWASRIAACDRVDVDLPGGRREVRLSVGVAAAAAGSTATHVLAEADRRMYAQKQAVSRGRR